MLQAALAFFPLLSAYHFCTHWWRLRFRLARMDSQRLYLAMAGYGVLLAVIAVLLAIALLHLSAYRELIEQLPGTIVGLSGEAPAPYVPLLIASLVIVTVLGPLAAELLNLSEWLLWEWRRLPAGYIAAELAVQKDDFDLILFRAWSSEQAVMLTLSNGHIFVGQVLRAIDPDEDRKTLRLLPLMGGYRDAEHRTVFTTHYDCQPDPDTPHNTSAEGPPRRPCIDTELAIDRSRIITLSLFDFDSEFVG